MLFNLIHHRSVRATLAALALASVVAAPAPHASAAGVPHAFSTVSTWLTGTRATFVQGWDGVNDRVAVNQKGTDGRFDGHWATQGGTLLSCVTCTVPDSTSTQRAIMDVFPSGDHVVLTAEKSSHPGPPIGDPVAEPGKGVFNDIWIARSDGSQAWQMTNIPNNEDSGIIWPRLNAQGTRIVWAEMYRRANVFLPKEQTGVWRLKVAEITWANGTPSFTNIRTYEPEAGNLYEPYGFSPDGSQILFASSAFMPGVSDTQIYRVSWQLTNLTRLSDQHTPGWANYNEFAFYTPDGSRIIYGRVKESSGGGLDYWIMNADGSGQERLTWLNEPWSPQSRGYSNVGGWAIDPDNPNRFLAGVCHDLFCSTGEVVTVNLTSATVGSGTGLKAEYFSDPYLFSRRLTRTDRYVGFVWGDASPASGIPADNFSVRWTGSLRPYATGYHWLCTYSDDGARLWVDNVQLVNAWYNQSASQNCGLRWLSAGSTYPIKMEYYDAYGGAIAKLTWSVPGQSGNSQEVIPIGQLTPAP